LDHPEAIEAQGQAVVQFEFNHTGIIDPGVPGSGLATPGRKKVWFDHTRHGVTS
jgi:hypothetical protein